MTAEDLEAFRALLRAQATPSPKVGIARRVLRRVAGGGAPVLLGVLELETPAPPPPRPSATPSAMFGRREPEPPPPRAAAAAPPPPEPCGALLLTTLLPAALHSAPPSPSGRVALRVREDAYDNRFATPVDPRPPAATRDSSVTVAIGGWSVAAPPSARTRRLARIAAVCDAERRGLEARLAGVGP